MNNNLIKFLLKLKNASLSRKEFLFTITSSKIVENIVFGRFNTIFSIEKMEKFIL
jgi:hypothetical protein